MHKNTWYAVYHQRELDYLARSYQPGYFFILMGGEYMTEFLPIDGSKPMTGDLDIDTHSLVFTSDIGFFRADAFTLRLMNQAKTHYRNIRLQNLESLGRVETNTIIETTPATGVTIDSLLVKEGGLPSAGDITGVAGKTLSFPNITGENLGVLNWMQFFALDAAPPAPPDGILCCADRINWDPLGRGAGERYLVFYDGAAWKAVSSP